MHTSTAINPDVYLLPGNDPMEPLRDDAVPDHTLELVLHEPVWSIVLLVPLHRRGNGSFDPGSEGQKKDAWRTPGRLTVTFSVDCSSSRWGPLAVKSGAHSSSVPFFCFFSRSFSTKGFTSEPQNCWFHINLFLQRLNVWPYFCYSSVSQTDRNSIGSNPVFLTFMVWTPEYNISDSLC